MLPERSVDQGMPVEKRTSPTNREGEKGGATLKEITKGGQE